MLKRSLSFLIIAAFLLSTVSMVAFADTVINVEGVDDNGNFIFGNSYNAPTGWSGDGIQWNDSFDGTKTSRIYGGNGIQTNLYSFEAGVNYKIYISAVTNNSEGKAMVSVDGTSLGEVTVGNSQLTEVSWDYIAASTGNPTIVINRVGYYELEVAYFRVEQVGEAAPVVPAVDSVKAIKGEKSYAVTDGMDNLVGGATALEITFTSAPSDTAQYNSTNIAVTSGGQTVTTTVAPKEGDDKTAVVTFNMGYTTTYTLTVSGISNGAGTAETVTYTFTTAERVDTLTHEYTSDDGNYYYCVDGKKNDGFTGGDAWSSNSYGRVWDGSVATTAYYLEAGVEYTITGKFGGDGDTSAVRLDVDGTSQGSQTIGRKTSREDFVELSWTYTPERSGNASIAFVKEGNTIYFDYMNVKGKAPADDTVSISAVKGDSTITAVVKGADAGDDVYLALYAADETLAKCYKLDYAGEDVVFTPEGDYATATVYLWKDGTVVPLCPAAPVK